MYSRTPESWLRCWLALILLACMSGPLAARQTGDPSAIGDYRAFLVTYGPGDVYWQRFGHNAIWLQEPGRGLDHSYNFGFFDFQQENFLLRFVQGRMLYFAAALPVGKEMGHYRSEGRSIRVQELDLDPRQYTRLRDHLVDHVKPENRDYLYDYYLDNCSTRLRDALDLALDGTLVEQFMPQPGLQTFRSHTRRSTVDDFWYYLGLELALGVPVDQPISRWDEMFLPAILADNLNEITFMGEDGLRSLVADDRLVSESRTAPPDSFPPEVWERYLGISLLLVALGLLAAKFIPAVLVEGWMQAWMLIAGTLGMLMVADWLWTDHVAANPNANLLLFNPLMVLAVVPALRKTVAAVTALGLLGAVVILAMPHVQYTRDVAALVMPLHLVSAYRLWFFRSPVGWVRGGA